MKIETNNDVRLVSRAITSRWDVPKAEVLEATMELVRCPDLEMKSKGVELAIKMNNSDLKIDELENKRKATDDNQRLRLIELARSVPIADLAAIASKHGITTG